MKKHLFLIASVFAVFSLQAQTSTVTVAANTNVKVKSGTLFYVNGDMTMGTYTESNKKFSNEGNVKVTNNLNNSAGDNVSFVNEYVSSGKYGQLIVSSTATTTNKIASGLKFKDGFGFYPLAIPYSGITAENVVAELLGSEAVGKTFKGYNRTKYYRGFDKNRIPGNALFFWDNGKYQFTQLKKEDEIGKDKEEARYYAVNNTSISKAGKLDLTKVKYLKGTPINKEVTVTLTKYEKLKNHSKRIKDADNKATDNMNVGVNKYGEAYGSYIVDFVTAMPGDWGKYFLEVGGVPAGDFGLRIYNLGNPYTSNIDLVKLLKDSDNTKFKEKVQAIAQYGEQNYDTEINTYGSKISGSVGQEAGFSGLTKDGVGDDILKIVPPFQTFVVKMTSDMDITEKLKFNDNVKTFKGTGERGTGAVFNTVFAKGGERGSQINQVALDLLDENGDITGLRTYVVASNIYEASNKGEGTELYNPKLTDENTGIYTLQEKEDGSIDENLANNKAYINGVNADKYVGKPIHLVVQNGKGQYILRTRLNEDLSKNKNAFYFEDKKEGKVLKIDENFSYTFNVDGTEKDRFVLYWAAIPNNEKVEEIAKRETNTTVVFKDADTYKVRFDKGINKADIFVYNISGQLVNTAKNIDTSVDYIVPLRGSSSVYVIKVVGDNGIVVTKKIIK